MERVEVGLVEASDDDDLIVGIEVGIELSNAVSTILVAEQMPL